MQKPMAQRCLAALLCAASGLPAACHAAPASVWSDWLTALRSQGYTVTQGIASPHNCDDLVAVFKDCNGNNPAGLYADIQVPVDGEYLDPCYNDQQDCSPPGQNLFTQTVLLPDGSQADTNPFYRLSDAQALAVIVKLPPQAAYFGYQNYVWSRARSAYGQDCESTVPQNPDPCRALVRANVGNSINHLTIFRQSGLTLGSGGTVAFITTSNQMLYSRLAAAFKQVGGNPSQLFVEPLSSKVTAGKYAAGIVTGLGADGDELNPLVRYTLPQDPTAGDAWLNAIADNIQVYRIEKPDAAMARVPPVRIAPKHYTPGESDYQAALNELADALQTWLQSTQTSAAITLKMGSSATYSPTGQPQAGVVGPICLQQETDCRRSTDDTDAYRNAAIGTLEHTAVMAGVDSTQTGNAAYMSIGVYRADLVEGFYSLAQTNPQAAGFASGTLGGSAQDFVADLIAEGAIPAPSPTLAQALPKLYVAIVTRDCPTGSSKFFCAKPYTIKIDPNDIPPDQAIVLARRAYLHPGDLNGANPTYLATPLVIK